MLALVGLVEDLVARNEIDYKTGWFWEWRFSGHAANKASRYDVLCFGDSLVNHGVIPLIIEQHLGLKAYNFALSGGQSSTSYFQLRRTGPAHTNVMTNKEFGREIPAAKRNISVFEAQSSYVRR